MLNRLSGETTVHHADADADLDRYIFGERTHALDYRAYLASVFTFVLPLEASLSMVSELDGLIDLEARRKAIHLLRDLRALGMSSNDVDLLPLCAVPRLVDPATALGWLYVAERPMLASAVIRRHLSTRLHVQIARASAYLSCYAGAVGMRWRELGAVMDRVAVDDAAAERVIAGAHEAFRCQQRWRLAQTAPPRLAV